jgi:hypothetical protein
MIMLRIGFVLVTIALGYATVDIIRDSNGVSPGLCVAIILGFIQCYGQITGWNQWRSKRRIEPLPVKGVGWWRKDINRSHK